MAPQRGQPWHFRFGLHLACCVACSIGEPSQHLKTFRSYRPGQILVDASRCPVGRGPSSTYRGLAAPESWKQLGWVLETAGPRYSSYSRRDSAWRLIYMSNPAHSGCCNRSCMGDGLELCGLLRQERDASPGAGDIKQHVKRSDSQ
ncbi:hypothetical protein CIHG_04052 [Coccidioides immitis H538.4]|uniref:Secreted protein n=1 Tax=Coccidioides immitis H538.4 TaxID=396776 RepID=A0A0J8RME0_COCIT|nr:hypothetical protein CIHG_04052 [Coccidioides immitis H538.4]